MVFLCFSAASHLDIPRHARSATSLSSPTSAISTTTQHRSSLGQLLCFLHNTTTPRSVACDSSRERAQGQIEHAGQFPPAPPPPQSYLKLSTALVVAWTVPRLRPRQRKHWVLSNIVSDKRSAALHFHQGSHTDARSQADLTNLVTYRPPCRSNLRKKRLSRRAELAEHRAFPQ